MIKLTTEDPTSATAQALIAALTAELEGRYEPSAGITFDVTRMPELHNVAQNGVTFVVIWQNDEPVGCGAIRPMDDESVEVKRMYVAPQARGQGLSKQILAKLESLALAQGYNKTRLETGIRQPEAIGLYEKAGYQPIPCFGVYANEPMSRCYEKKLR